MNLNGCYCDDCIGRINASSNAKKTIYYKCTLILKNGQALKALMNKNVAVELSVATMLQQSSKSW
jgi:hypothetical protein